MDQFSFPFTIIFMLLGPVKLIPFFARVTQGASVPFKRSVAIRGSLIAFALCMFVALVGATLLGNYRISINAVRIAGGLVLLYAALQATFAGASSLTPRADASTPTAMQLAASPVAVPNIVPPAGVAVILLFMMIAPENPGLSEGVYSCLAIVMLMDFLVMYFIDSVVKTPGLTIILPVLGAVLVFVQICLAIQLMLIALADLRLVRG